MLRHDDFPWITADPGLIIVFKATAFEQCVFTGLTSSSPSNHHVNFPTWRKGCVWFVLKSMLSVNAGNVWHWFIPFACHVSADCCDIILFLFTKINQCKEDCHPMFVSTIITDWTCLEVSIQYRLFRETSLMLILSSYIEDSCLWYGEPVPFQGDCYFSVQKLCCLYMR